MNDYKVCFADLRSAADGFKQLHQQAQQQRTRLDGVQLGQPDFGRVPWLQTRVFEAFTTHTQECQTALEDLTQALEATGEGLNATAEAYETVERAAAEALTQFFEAVK